ncbi:ricin-type beta-trefoil lectin domain protein [Candidatus Albibeggiatoa sp. nov. BB20]|uniref:ricin-type beta-trefoil lectin domain protein n=1 Tax=Candidatus Albibeggiatoa sp. nov. BB20 TaxID=3162723 RepID=UPI0033656110
MSMKFTFLMTTLLWLLSNMAYAAEGKISCESSNSQYRHCSIDTNGKEVRIFKQLSSTRCTINDTWGYDNRGVWVDKGCRAAFIVEDSSSNDSRIAPNVPSSTADDETFSIRSENGKCLDILGADFDARKNGGRVYLWDCHGGKNQRWWFENGALTNSGGKCLDVHRPDFDSKKNGGLIQVWDCNGSVNQKWTLKRNTLVSGNGLCLDVHSSDFKSRANNGKVQLWKCSSGQNQRWNKYEYSKDGKYQEADNTEVKHVDIFLVNDVRYWVDTNPAWAGVYYPLVANNCPYGGKYAGGNCIIYRFSKDEDIRRGATYWIRTERGWAGAYYKQIKDRCPYGGRKVNELCQILTFN